MIKNWAVSAWLSSPLCGEPPAFDAILAWEMAFRLGMKHHNKTGRWTFPDDIKDVPIPLAQRTLDGRNVYCCSDPILPPLQAPEWVDHTTKRFESSKMALLIAPEHRKTLLTASGPYKSRFVPERVRLVDRVVWLVRGDREEMNKLLKSVRAIGRHRAIGYGSVWRWTFDEAAADNSIFAMQNGKPVLMRTMPMGPALDNACGYKRSYGGWRPPYWHPGFMCEVAVPC